MSNDQCLNNSCVLVNLAGNRQCQRTGLPAGATCFEVQPYVSDESCASGLYCQRASLPFDEAPTQQSQIEGTCVAALGPGAQCIDSASCASGLCDFRECTCVPAPGGGCAAGSVLLGGACLTDRWCQSGSCAIAFADRATGAFRLPEGLGVCVAGDLPDGSWCFRLTGSADTADSDCASGICYRHGGARIDGECIPSNVITGPCYEDRQCIAERRCSIPVQPPSSGPPGLCVGDPLPGGHPCDENSDCMSGLCEPDEPRACADPVIGGGSCTVNSQCVLSGICWSDGLCGIPNRSACSLDTQCRSRSCIYGVCNAN